MSLDDWAAQVSKQESRAAAELPDVLVMSELAELLRISPRTLARWLAKGQVPGVRKIGREYRASKSVILEWIADGTPMREP